MSSELKLEVVVEWNGDTIARHIKTLCLHCFEGIVVQGWK